MDPPGFSYAGNGRPDLSLHLGIGRANPSEDRSIVVGVEFD